MTNTQPFNPWIFHFLAAFGFFQISDKKALRFLQCSALTVVVTLIYVVGFDFESFIYHLQEMPFLDKMAEIESKLVPLNFCLERS